MCLPGHTKCFDVSTFFFLFHLLWICDWIRQFYMLHVICSHTASVCIFSTACHGHGLCGRFSLFYDFQQHTVVNLSILWVNFKHFCMLDMSQFPGMAKKPKLTHFTHVRSVQYRLHLPVWDSEPGVWGVIGNIRVYPTIWYQIEHTLLQFGDRKCATTYSKR